MTVAMGDDIVTQFPDPGRRLRRQFVLLFPAFNAALDGTLQRSDSGAQFAERVIQIGDLSVDLPELLSLLDDGLVQPLQFFLPLWLLPDAAGDQVFKFLRKGVSVLLIDQICQLVREPDAANVRFLHRSSLQNV